MKIAVVYYSRSHTTEKVAKRIAQELNAELVRVNSGNYPLGPIGYIRALIHSLGQKQVPIETQNLNFKNYDLSCGGFTCLGLKHVLTHQKFSEPAGFKH